MKTLLKNLVCVNKNTARLGGFFNNYSKKKGRFFQHIFLTFFKTKNPGFLGFLFLWHYSRKNVPFWYSFRQGI